jgi:hypothetical protein
MKATLFGNMTFLIFLLPKTYANYNSQPLNPHVPCHLFLENLQSDIEHTRLNELALAMAADMNSQLRKLGAMINEKDQPPHFDQVRIKVNSPNGSKAFVVFETNHKGIPQHILTPTMRITLFDSIRFPTAADSSFRIQFLTPGKMRSLLDHLESYRPFPIDPVTKIAMRDDWDYWARSGDSKLAKKFIHQQASLKSNSLYAVTQFENKIPAQLVVLKHRGPFRLSTLDQLFF